MSNDLIFPSSNDLKAASTIFPDYSQPPTPSSEEPAAVRSPHVPRGSLPIYPRLGRQLEKILTENQPNYKATKQLCNLIHQTVYCWGSLLGKKSLAAVSGSASKRCVRLSSCCPLLLLLLGSSLAAPVNLLSSCCPLLVHCCPLLVLLPAWRGC